MLGVVSFSHVFTWDLRTDSQTKPKNFIACFLQEDQRTLSISAYIGNEKGVDWFSYNGLAWNFRCHFGGQLMALSGKQKYILFKRKQEYFLRNLQDKKEKEINVTTIKQEIKDIQFSPDERFLVFYYRDRIKRYSEQTVEVWEIDAQEKKCHLRLRSPPEFTCAGVKIDNTQFDDPRTKLLLEKLR